MRASFQAALQRGDLRQLALELMRFVGVGGVTTVVYFVALWGVAKASSGPMWLLAAIACVPSLMVGYVLHRSYTFRSDKQHQTAGPRFLVVQLAGIAFNSFVIWIGSDLLHLPFLLVQGAAIGMQVVLTYLGQKFFAFNR
jgi:putative flippase GtrA